MIRVTPVRLGSDMELFQQRKTVRLKKWEESWRNRNVKAMPAGRILNGTFLESSLRDPGGFHGQNRGRYITEADQTRNGPAIRQWELPDLATCYWRSQTSAIGMVDQSFKLLMTKVGVFQLQFQSLQIDDSSIGVGNLRTILKLTFANREIVAVISGGTMRMNGLWLRFMFRLTSHFPILSLPMASSRFASSMRGLRGLQGERRWTVGTWNVLDRHWFVRLM